MLPLKVGARASWGCSQCLRIEMKILLLGKEISALPRSTKNFHSCNLHKLKTRACLKCFDPCPNISLMIWDCGLEISEVNKERLKCFMIVGALAHTVNYILEGKLQTKGRQLIQTEWLSISVTVVCTRASQNFRGYLPHSGLSSEWAGATLVGVSEG